MITEEVGTEEEEMTLTCSAAGGYPASTVTWLVPEGLHFSVEEEVIVNVSIVKRRGLKIEKSLV